MISSPKDLRLGRHVAISGALHAGVLSFMFLVPFAKVPPVPVERVYEVSLVSLPEKKGELPDRLAVPESPAIPEGMAEPEKPSKEARVSEKRREEIIEAIKREVLLARIQSEIKGKRLALPPGPEDLEGPLATSSAMSPGLISARAAYQALVSSLVKENWVVIPRLVAENPDLAAVVHVTLDATGAILSSILAGSSGNDSFDQSCLRAVKKTKTLPLPPPELLEEAIQDGIVITFKASERL